MKGYIQIYTGNGKGKTTAALGLALRAAGSGKKVFIGQFLKSGNYSEIKALKKMADLIMVEQYGTGRFIKGHPDPEDIEAGMAGYKRLTQVVEAGEHEVVILDEGNIAVQYNIFSEQDLLDLLAKKPDHVEIVVTGRGATQAIMEKADLVVEIKNIKHYFEKGVEARVGIEK